MEIVRDFPPLFDEIDAAFHVRGKPVIFAWGTRIYNPQGIAIPAFLLAHEEVHGRRQLAADVVDWWKRYIASADFRLAEELPAHRAEYAVRLAEARCRNQRRAALKETARRLAAPLYGRMVSRSRAERLIRSEA